MYQTYPDSTRRHIQVFPMFKAHKHRLLRAGATAHTSQMAAPNNPTFVEYIQLNEFKGAKELFDPLGAAEKYELLKAVFGGQDPVEDEGDAVPIGLSDEKLVERALKWFNDDFKGEKAITFEKFIYETVLVEPTVFTNMRLKSLLRFDSAVLGRFLEERGTFKSSILSYGLDFYLTAGLAPSHTSNAPGCNVVLSFVQFLTTCKENGATAFGMLFPSPSNIQNLTNSPYLMDYLEVFASNGILDRLLVEPVYDMFISLCSKKSQVNARNFMIEKKFGDKVKRFRGLLAVFALFIVLELVQAILAIVKHNSGLMMASGIVKICSYLVLALTAYGVESEIFSILYFLSVTASNGIFALSADKVGALKWILFGVQLLPIVVALKTSDTPILPFRKCPKKSTALGRKFRRFENKLLCPRSFFKLLFATFLLTAVVTVINIVATVT